MGACRYRGQTTAHRAAHACLFEPSLRDIDCQLGRAVRIRAGRPAPFHTCAEHGAHRVWSAQCAPREGALCAAARFDPHWSCEMIHARW